MLSGIQERQTHLYYLQAEGLKTLEDYFRHIVMEIFHHLLSLW